MRIMALALLAGLGACASTVTPTPSRAILEARAAAAEQVKHARDPAPCVDPRSIKDEDATIIRFLFLSPSLDETGVRALDRVVAFARCSAATPIVLVAEADGHATPDAQKALIVQRVAAMRQGLTAAGIADARITTAAARPAATGGPLVLLGRNLGG